MKRSTNLFSLIILLFSFFTGYCFPQSKTPTLQFLGNAFVKIETLNGKVIYIDPYAVNAPDSADIVLVTHEHECHNDLTRIIPKKLCTIIRPASALIDGAYQSFEIDGIKITAKPAYNKYHPKDEGVGYLLEFDGIKVYHAGGTSKIPEMADLASEKIDYALYPLTPGPEEMTQAAALVQAQHDIPIHSNVSLDRSANQSYINRFKPPNKLVLQNDQIINLIHENVSVSGYVHRVPQDYSSIQAAIDASQNGDTVLVSEGTYFENINFRGKGIVVASKYILTNDWQTVKTTIIDGSKSVNKDTASTVQFLNKEDSAAVIEGFTITGGSGTKYVFSETLKYQEGAGVILSYSSAVVKNNLIINNGIKPFSSDAKDGGGGGIASMYGNPTICNNVIASNNSGYAGGIVLNWSNGQIRNNIIYHNTGRASYGTGGVMLWKVPAGPTFLENNTIVGNTSLKDAGGINIKVDKNVIPVVKNNIVWGNRQVTGGQVLNPQYSKYNNIEDYSDVNNISVNPNLIDDNFMLTDGSPCIDAGDPDTAYNDISDPNKPGSALIPSKGNIRNDIGAFGGALTKYLTQFEVEDIYTLDRTHIISGQTGKEKIYKIEYLNLSSHSIRIDSIAVGNKNVFTVSSKLDVYSDRSKRVLASLENDTILVNCKTEAAGTTNDTVYVYHNVEGLVNPVKIAIQLNAVTVGINDENKLPNDFKLFQNEPNPFNPSTRIRFNVAHRANVSLKIFDILGREVATLINGEMETGIHSVVWNPQHGICSGIYLVNMTTENMNTTKKMVYQK